MLQTPICQNTAYDFNIPTCMNYELKVDMNQVRGKKISTHTEKVHINVCTVKKQYQETIVLYGNWQ